MSLGATAPICPSSQEQAVCGQGCLTQDGHEAAPVCEDPYPKAQDHSTQHLQGEGQSVESQSR